MNELATGLAKKPIEWPDDGTVFGSGPQPPFEVVIPVHQKDYSKLPYVLTRLYRYTEPQLVHLITPEPATLPSLNARLKPHVRVHADCDVLSIPRPKGYKMGRTDSHNWVWQQFLKLFQNVTETEWFLGMDADLLMNAPYPLFIEGKPAMVLSRNPFEVHEPYRVFNQVMLGLDKLPWSHLSDATLYSRSIIKDMLSASGYDVAAFIQRAAEVINPDCYPADAEIYGAWIATKHPALYHYVLLNNEMNGRYRARHYSPHEIEKIMTHFEGNTHIHTISIHSWGPG